MEAPGRDFDHARGANVEVNTIRCAINGGALPARKSGRRMIVLRSAGAFILTRSPLPREDRRG